MNSLYLYHLPHLGLLLQHQGAVLIDRLEVGRADRQQEAGGDTGGETEAHRHDGGHAVQGDQSLSPARHRGDPQQGAGEAGDARHCEEEGADQEVGGEEGEEIDLERSDQLSFPPRSQPLT